jgi:hypothetical protein
MAEDFMAILPKLADREMMMGLRSPAGRSSPSHTWAFRAVTIAGKNFSEIAQAARIR